MFSWDYLFEKKNAAVGTADVRTLHVFYVIQGLFKDFPGLFSTIYLKPSEMFVLNDTGLALWYSDN